MAPFFDEVQAVIAGARLPLDGGSTQVLHFMLERPEGCDVSITRETFYIQYGWHLAHHRYTRELAPRIVSWLCERAPAGYLAAGSLPWWFDPTGVEQETFVAEGGGRIVNHGPVGPSWSYGPRRIWLEAYPDLVTIMIRDAAIDPGPDAIPAPIEPPIRYLTGRHPCPHCRTVPERYRELRDGALVCLACGRSSAPPA